MSKTAKQISEEIFYKPATNNQAENSIQEGVKLIENYAKEKAIQAVKEIRIIEDNHFQKSKFCGQHNFQMDQIKHQQIENELRRVCNIIQNTFDTGYISTPQN